MKGSSLVLMSPVLPSKKHNKTRWYRKYSHLQQLWLPPRKEWWSYVKISKANRRSWSKLLRSKRNAWVWCSRKYKEWKLKMIASREMMKGWTLKNKKKSKNLPMSVTILKNWLKMPKKDCLTTRTNTRRKRKKSLSGWRENSRASTKSWPRSTTSKWTPSSQSMTS